MTRTSPTYRDHRRTEADLLAGRAMASARVAMNLNQRELAERLQDLTGQPWNQAKVSNFETAKRLLAPAQAVQVALALELDPDTLLGVFTHRNGDAFAALTPCPDVDTAGYPRERVEP